MSRQSRLRKRLQRCGAAAGDDHCTFDVTHLTQCLNKYRVRIVRRNRESKKTNHRHRRLLRPRHQRPRSYTAKPRDKFPPSHPSSPEATMWGSLSRSGSHGNGCISQGDQPPATFFAARKAALGPLPTIACSAQCLQLAKADLACEPPVGEPPRLGCGAGCGQAHWRSQAPLALMDCAMYRPSASS
jgi:hypothetical protein